MKTTLLYLAFFCFGFTGMVHHAAAQGIGQNKSKFVRKVQRVVWTAGISWVAVDDDGRPFRDLFNTRQSWNLLPLSTNIHLDGCIKNGWSAELSVAYTRYKSGKMVNNDFIPLSGTFIAVDANARYTSKKARTITPCFIAGLGYTFRSALAQGKSCPTLNLGVGFIVWLQKGFGIRLQSVSKFKTLPSSSNYLIHSAGVAYRFDLIHGYKAQHKSNRRHQLFGN